MFRGIRFGIKKAYVFAAKTASGEQLACPVLAGQFYQFKSVIYYAINNQVYALDLTNVRAQTRALATPVAVKGQYYAAKFGGILVDDFYVYYTDLVTNRVLRNKRK